MRRDKLVQALVPAVYEHGVLRPLEPLTLDEHTQVKIILWVAQPFEVSADLAKRQSTAVQALQQRLAAIPADTVDDGLSGRDHDRILYGLS
jgi:predicted DNA-binding antitoxin AbrB/MazE fold protein